MEGSFGPFRWDGLAVDALSYEAEGPGVVAALFADRLHTEVDLAGVRRGVWELNGTSVGQVEVQLDTRRRPDGEGAGRVAAEVERAGDRVGKAGKSGWMPQRVEVSSLELRDVVVKALLEVGEVRASGMQVRIEQAGGARIFRGNVTGGRVRLPFSLVPEAEIDRMRLRVAGDEVFVTDATARVFKGGKFSGAGEWSYRDKNYTFEGNVDGVKCDEFLNADWAKRLTGDAATDVVVMSGERGPVVKGTLVIENGVLTALPVLDVLAAYADTRRFRVLNLTEARTGWRWEEGVLTFSDLVLASEGLVRLEGQVSVRGRELDGRFRLGLAPGTLAGIPGAETVVFLPGEKGLRWSPLRITGTLDDPREDLTERLVAAAEGRMFELIPETGERVLKFTRSVLGAPQQVLQEGVQKGVQQGAEVIGKATGTLGDAAGSLIGGVVGGLLGGQPLIPPKPQVSGGDGAPKAPEAPESPPDSEKVEPPVRPGPGGAEAPGR